MTEPSRLPLPHWAAVWIVLAPPVKLPLKIDSPRVHVGKTIVFFVTSLTKITLVAGVGVNSAEI